MRLAKAFGTFVLVLPLCTSALGQTLPPRAVPDRPVRTVESDLQRRMWDMARLEGRMRALSKQHRTPAPEPHLTDEEKDRVLKLRKVDAVDLERYDLFLRQPDTGIFKLFPNLGCMSKSVVSLAGECSRFVPLSSSFTFRTNHYTDEIYHDIYYKDERIVSDSFFSQGIFVAIGDEPIERIDLTHNALKYLVGFRSDTETDSAKEHAKELKSGIDANGYRYADHVEPKENVTYAMRMLAYRLGNSLKPLTEDTPMNEMMFHSLAVDKRLDIIVLFRILRRDENAGLTIVWKELSRTEAGKLKFGKNEPLRDFRTELD